MKEKYEALEVEVIEFEAEDVITASGCNDPTLVAYTSDCGDTGPDGYIA